MTERKQKFTDLHFEPHMMFGHVIDGEAMPFGYISQQGHGKPVFELTPIFDHEAQDLTALALKMSAAPEMLKALKALRDADEAGRGDGQNFMGPEMLAAVEAAIFKAEGQS
jgi:hypothetical protein